MKKNLLRLLSLLLACTMLVTAVGCEFPSGHESEPESQPEQESQTESETESVEESKVPECKEHDFELAETKDPTCSTLGYELYRCTVCGKEKKTTLLYTEHVHAATEEDGDDYVKIVHCDVCGAEMRRPSERIYDEDFVYDMTEERIEEIKASYQKLMDFVGKAGKYNASKHKFVKDSAQYKKNKDFEHTYFDPFDEELEYAIEQYQFSYVQFCVNQGDETCKANYDLASDFYNEVIEMYYKVFRPIYETEYRDYFFSEEDGWSEEDIQRILATSDLYSNPRCTELRKQQDDIQIKFRDIADASYDVNVPYLFEDFVEVNQELAQLFGYDNYMDYAYADVYERDYTVEDVHAMRAFVKQYLGNGLIFDFYNYQSKLKSSYSAYLGSSSAKSVFKDTKALNFVADYFATVKSDKYKNEIDFYAELNKLLKEGNYYTGKYEGAFSYYLSTRDNTILYFGPGSYSSPFTFVHEFGHYFNNIYNHGINLSMDHDETQSQGDEMLFLGYLRDRMEKAGESKQFPAIEAAKLMDSLQTILLATAVDEFEELVYTGYYDGDHPAVLQALEDGVIDHKEYDSVFNGISEPYGLNDLYYPIYWRFVTIEAPGYYISYAMSLIPSLAVYVKSVEEGYEAAQDAYLRLFTFSDDPKMAHEDASGDLVCDVDYADVLEYCGFFTAFDENTYKSLYEIYKVCRNK